MLARKFAGRDKKHQLFRNDEAKARLWHSPKTMARAARLSPSIATGPSRPSPTFKAKTSGRYAAGLEGVAPRASPAARRRTAPKTMGSNFPPVRFNRTGSL